MKNWLTTEGNRACGFNSLLHLRDGGFVYDEVGDDSDSHAHRIKIPALSRVLPKRGRGAPAHFIPCQQTFNEAVSHDRDREFLTFGDAGILHR